MQRTRVPAVARVFHQVREIAPLDVPVLLLGETGSGKEEVAHALHALSGRAGERIEVNAATLAPELAARDLFGAVAGAYTGASSAVGLVRAAHGGTLMLDEFGELSAPVQAALLRVLEDGRVRPVGAERAVPVDVRWVLATHRDLRRDAATGRFRTDLMYRVEAGEVLVLPPLRERLEDLPDAVDAILADGQVPARFEACALERLREHRWPGNFRELRGVVLRSARGRHEVRAADLRFGMSATDGTSLAGSPGLDGAARAALLKEIREAMQAEPRQGERPIAARFGITRGRLRRLLRAARA